MKLLKIIPLTFVLLLGACSTNDTGSSSQPVNPSTPSETSELDLYGFDLKKTEDIATTETYNLANQINLHQGVSLSDLKIEVANKSIATVNEAGVLTRVAYGSTQVTVVRKSLPIYDKPFTIHFFPAADSHIGRFSAELTPAAGHETEKVTATIETKADNKFTISYTAGWFSVENDDASPYHFENAIEAEGMFELEGILKFTVTSESFTLKKRFSGRLSFDGSNPYIQTRVPVSSENRSDMTNLLKAAA